MPDTFTTAINLLLKTVLRSDVITYMVLTQISPETMDVVHSILLQCPNLTMLDLRRSRLDYDGILYIYRKNTVLKHLVIHGHRQRPQSELVWERPQSKVVCKRRTFSPAGTINMTNVLLELNNILRDNKTLEDLWILSEPTKLSANALTPLFSTTKSNQQTYHNKKGE